MRFQTPQFIEVEDKIIGPLTLKQFVYLVGAGGLGFALWRFLPRILALFAILPVIGLGAALAFYKVNNKPFVNILESAVKYFFNTKLYVWSKEDKKAPLRSKKKGRGDQESGAVLPLSVPALSESKLKDLTWSLDVNENM
jgi:hypothetical protein